MGWIDWLLLAMVLFSCIAGLMRGLLRELIALATWIIEVWEAWHFSGLIEEHLSSSLQGGAVGRWVGRGLILLAVVLVGGAIGALVNHLMRLSIFSGTDRAFGALFGLLRGLVMLGLFVMLCHAVRLDGESWWHRSLLVPYAERAANVLRGLVGERKMVVGESVSATR